MGNTSIKDFNIPITGSKQGVLESSFGLGSDFFQLFENSLVEKGKLMVRVRFKKSEALIHADFEIKGSVELFCDRSLEPFDHRLNINREHLYKFGDHQEDFSEDITLIPFDTHLINVGQLLYEYIGLEIPFRKLHPRFLNEDGTEKEFVFETNEDAEKSEPDPRWEELNKIRKK